MWKICWGVNTVRHCSLLRCDLGGGPKDPSDTIIGEGENNSPYTHCCWGPCPFGSLCSGLSLWFSFSYCGFASPVWMGALTHTGTTVGLIWVESDPLLSPGTQRPTDPPGLSHRVFLLILIAQWPWLSLSSALSWAAGLPALHWSPEGVLRVHPSPNRLLCPISFPHCTVCSPIVTASPGTGALSSLSCSSLSLWNTSSQNHSILFLFIYLIFI